MLSDAGYRRGAGHFCLHLFVFPYWFFFHLNDRLLNFLSFTCIAIKLLLPDKYGNLDDLEKKAFHVSLAVHIHAAIVSNFENLHTCALPSCVIFYAWLPPLLLRQLLGDR